MDRFSKAAKIIIQAAQSTDKEIKATRPVVCHVIHALGVGGAEVLVDAMVRRMSDRFECVVAVLDEIGEIGEQLRADGYTVHHLHRQPGIDRGCAKRLRAFADEHHVDVLHAHQYTPFFQSMLSRGLLGRRPVLFTEHGRHFPDLPSKKRSVVNRLLLNRRDRLVGCGGAVRQALIDNEGLPASRVEVVYNGVDLQELAAGDASRRSTLRSEFGFDDDDFVAIQVARLHELKDHATAVATIQEAAKSNGNIKLLIVGEGDQRESIEAEIAARRLQDQVVLAGNRNDVPDLLTASDAFLMTSISEGIPLTIIEAMAAGLPVVSTAVGGIPEMIQHGQSGFLAEAKDANTLAEHLVHLATDEKHRQAIIEQGRLQAKAKFSLDSMLNGYAAIYREMVDHG